KPRSPFELMQANLGLAQLLAYEGDMVHAVPHFGEAFRVATSGVPDAVPVVKEMLALAHLHKAEMDNNVYRAPGDVCLIPTRPGQTLSKTAEADTAIEHLLNSVRRKPDDLEVRWLLNLAYM